MKTGLFILACTLSQMAFAAEEIIEIEVSGLTCPFCQDGLDRSLSKLPGVKNSKVSLKLKKARITMQPDQTLADDVLRHTVIDSGFTPGNIRREH